MRRTPLTLAALLGGIVLLNACTAGEASRPNPNEAVVLAPQEVVVGTRDFVFEAPDTIFSGTTTFRLINDGPDFHHIVLARLEDGHTVDELMRHMAHDGPPPPWVTFVGGPNTPGLPGEETNATLNLQPGTYVMLCVIPAPDGQPHTMKGMVKPLTVIPARGATAAMPAADLVMVLDDYSFDTDMEIRAGRRTIRIENVAEQPHEVLFVKLEPGKTATDFLHFMHKPEGVPPGKVVGGNTPMARGEVNLVTIDFEPGEYALLCFIPDAKDGAPHFMHGMAKQITVR
jgi:hypothetical protein